MGYKLQIFDDKAPTLRREVHIPDAKAEEIRSNEGTAVSIIRAIIGEYESVGELKYHRTFLGHKYLLDLNDKNQAMGEIQRDFMLHGTYEPETSKIVEEVVKEGDVAVDVGASIGLFTMLLAKQVGAKGKVYSIEPTSNQFPYLQENIKLNGYQDRVIAINKAAYDKVAGNESFKINLGQEGEVEAVVLDDILPEKVDFIKIDVDGAEPHVLKGLIKTIERNPQLKMVIEYYPEYIKNLGNDPKEMIDILDKYFDYKRIDGEFDETHFNYYCVRK